MEFISPVYPLVLLDSVCKRIIAVEDSCFRVPKSKRLLPKGWQALDKNDGILGSGDFSEIVAFSQCENQVALPTDFKPR